MQSSTRVWAVRADESRRLCRAAAQSLRNTSRARWLPALCAIPDSRSRFSGRRLSAGAQVSMSRPLASQPCQPL